MSNQTSLEATAVLLLCAPEKSLTSSHIIVKMKPTLSIKKKIKWKNSSKSYFTLCLWQWKRYWMLYAVKNFDHLPQQFHYLCLLALTSESRICVSESFFSQTPSHTHFSALLLHLCLALVSGSSSATVLGGFMCTTGIRWFYTVSWVFGASLWGKQQMQAASSTTHRQHKLYRALLSGPYAMPCSYGSFNAWDHNL